MGSSSSSASGGGEQNRRRARSIPIQQTNGSLTQNSQMSQRNAADYYHSQAALYNAGFPRGQTMPSTNQYLMDGMRPDFAFVPYPAQQMAPPPPPAVTQQTTTVRNDLNVQKRSLRCLLHGNTLCLAFTVDAVIDFRLTVYYCAKESQDRATKTIKFHSALPSPETLQFPSGLSQEIVLPDRCGLDVTAARPAELRRTTAPFPVVIKLETALGDSDTPDLQSQFTYASLEQLGDGSWAVKVIKQKIQVSGVSYELQEIYGIGEQTDAPPSSRAGASASAPGAAEDDGGKECVICLSADRDTTVLPCRHMCMCNECAQVLRYQSSKCPICRCQVESLLQIKVKPTQ